MQGALAVTPDSRALREVLAQLETIAKQMLEETRLEREAIVNDQIERLEASADRKIALYRELGDLEKRERAERIVLCEALGETGLLTLRPLCARLGDPQLQAQVQRTEGALRDLHSVNLEETVIIREAARRAAELREFSDRIMPELSRGQRRRITTTS